MILIIIGLLVMCCLLFVSGISSFIFYNVDKRQKKWDCIRLNDKHTVVGRINQKRDSECMYMIDTPGCFVISNPRDEFGKRYAPEIEEEKLKEECQNMIDNYPNPIVPIVNGSTVKLGIYSCGQGSTHQKLWNQTGYEDNKSDCYVIKERRSLLNEAKTWFNEIRKKK